MIVAEIARLTPAERVGVPVVVLAFSGHDIAAEATVAGPAKVLGVVLPLGVLALGNPHRPSSLCGGWQLHLLVGNRRNLPLDRSGTDDRWFGGVLVYSKAHLVVSGELARLPSVEFREVLFESVVTELLPEHVLHAQVLCFELMERQILGLRNH